MDYIDVNLSEFTAACPDRTHVYLTLIIKAMFDWTDQDYQDWFYATGWQKPRYPYGGL